MVPGSSQFVILVLLQKSWWISPSKGGRNLAPWWSPPKADGTRGVNVQHNYNKTPLGVTENMKSENEVPSPRWGLHNNQPPRVPRVPSAPWADSTRGYGPWPLWGRGLVYDCVPHGLFTPICDLILSESESYYQLFWRRTIIQNTSAVFLIGS